MFGAEDLKGHSPKILTGLTLSGLMAYGFGKAADHSLSGHSNCRTAAPDPPAFVFYPGANDGENFDNAGFMRSSCLMR